MADDLARLAAIQALLQAMTAVVVALHDLGEAVDRYVLPLAPYTAASVFQLRQATAQLRLLETRLRDCIGLLEVPDAP